MSRGDSVKVLDHGLVRLVDYMGGDLAISRSARVSYDAEGRDEDRGLINFLLMNGHNTPFESTCITIEAKSPIFVFRQWHRHRTQSYNELSARYRELPEEYYLPEADLIGTQSKDNKQMREIGEVLSYEERVIIDADLKLVDDHWKQGFILYRHLLKQGWPRELARAHLGVGVYSHMFATANLFNWFRFCKERTHPHAQHEIKVFADVILGFLAEVAPIATEAFREKYKL